LHGDPWTFLKSRSTAYYYSCESIALQLDPEKSSYLRAGPSSPRWMQELGNPAVLQARRSSAQPTGGAPGEGRAPLELAVVEATGRRPDLAGSCPVGDGSTSGEAVARPERADAGLREAAVTMALWCSTAQEGEKGASARMRLGQEKCKFPNRRFPVAFRPTPAGDSQSQTRVCVDPAVATRLTGLSCFSRSQRAFKRKQQGLTLGWSTLIRSPNY
jgi:hypothetical protein